MKICIAIADYGLGNLHSVYNAFNHLGYEVYMAEKGTDYDKASHVVLPGVGAFADGMRGLTERGHDEGLKQWVNKGGALLGICLGTQLFFDQSDEFGLNGGLGLIPGKVVEIPHDGIKIPFVGWSPLYRDRADWQGTVLSQTAEMTWVYFVHSYHCVPDDKSHVLAVTYGGENKLHAAVRRDNVVGFQFHPEKSGSAGLEMLKTFAQECK